ncbi:beta-lactamase [Beutenbergia cavernae DSM 12333]|uniref:Beta-lactamase n=1 Tax=Beutenbergia cavernae (strain ATCC BAA-8 / DSM 12333 / CCUG 43141 / JCM 11478 / NBRC 16432 / NCIMB 13614 / HKI 0122) TaxID=471853 RepID=C5BZB1_BEUC1|nr:serine hydrolase domain-containing protein [Beutenbergia cavernae]ACQ79083.1 beta-lactamase [Beutenbergia cavernae DSM 12333]
MTTTHPTSPTLDPAAPLPTSTPEREGIPSAAIGALLDALEAAGVEMHSLVLARHGNVVASGWWAPYRSDDITLMYSLSKSFTSTAVGVAVAEGRLGLDDAVTSFFPPAASAGAGPRTRAMRVRHLLAMSTGHAQDTTARLDTADPVGSFLAIEPDADPGTLFCYNSGATLMLSAILTELTGERLLDYARARVLDPLGIGSAYWSRFGRYDMGLSGLHVTTDDVARLGLMYLGGGELRGRRVVPAQWVETASAMHTDNSGRGAGPDWEQGYGFQLWRARHGYRGDGAFGQFCVVLPEHDVVLASTAATENMQGVLDAVWQTLLPAFSAEALPDDDVAHAALRDRLASLALPAVASVVPGSDGAWDLALTGPAADWVDGVRLEAAAGAARLVLAEDGVPLDLQLGDGTWVRTDVPIRDDRVLRVEATGGWCAPGVLEADVLAVNTPHHLRLRCDVASGTAHVAWHTVPLRAASLVRLAIPRAVLD